MNTHRVLRETLVIMTVLLLATFVFFPGAFFQGKTLLQADLLYYYSPWRELFPEMRSKPGNWILFDGILQFSPWRELVKESYLDGRIPLWDPGSFCGYPIAAAFQPGVFYPVDLLLLPLSRASLPAWRGLFHIMLAGVGMFWFLRLIPARFSSALLGGLLFPFCGFMIAWFGHPHFKVAAWLPWLFLAVGLAARRPTISRGLFLAFVCAMHILGGHIETSAHLFLAAGLYALFFLEDRSVPRSRFMALFAATVVFSMILAAIQLVPFAEYLANSSAFQARRHGVWGGTFFPVSFLICLVMPRFFGSTADGNSILTELNSSEAMGGFSGVIPLILALSTIFLIGRDRKVTRVAVLCVLCLAVVFKVPPFFELLHAIPMMKMSYNFRLVLIVSFTVITLCTLALDRIRDGSLRTVHVLIAWFAVTSGGVLAFFTHTDAFVEANISGYALANLRYFMLFAAVVPAILIVMKLRYRTVYFLPILLPICFANIWLEGSHYQRAWESGLLYPRPGILERIPASDQPFRVLPMGQTFPPHTSIPMGFHDIRGYDAITPMCIEEYMSFIDSDITGPKILPLFRLFSLKIFNHTLIDGLNVRYIITPQATGLAFWHGRDVTLPEGQYELIASDRGVSLYRNNAALPRAYLTGRFQAVRELEESRSRMASPDFPQNMHVVVDRAGIVPEPTGAVMSGQVRITAYGQTRIEMATIGHEPGLLVLADTFFPGWKASVDGVSTPVLRVNHALRGVSMSGGDHAVVFSYQPFSFMLGCFVTLCGLFIISMLVSFFCLFRCRRQRDCVEIT